MSDNPHDPDEERAVAEYRKEYSVKHDTLNNAIEKGRLVARKLISERGTRGGLYLIKQSDFDVWYDVYLQRKQKRENGFSEKSEIALKPLDNSERSEYASNSEESNGLSSER